MESSYHTQAQLLPMSIGIDMKAQSHHLGAHPLLSVHPASDMHPT